MPVQKVDMNSLEPEKKQLPTPPPERNASENVDEGDKSTTSMSKKVKLESEEKKIDVVGSSPVKIEQPSEKVADGTSDQEDKPVAKSISTETSGSSVSEEPVKSAEEKKDSKTDEIAKDNSKSTNDAEKKDGEGEIKKEDDEKEKKKLVPKGMKAEIKTLFAKGDNLCKCCTTWVEENPDESKSVEESDECRQHAIVVRKKKKHEGNRKPLKVDSIVVHSPLLKKVLIKIFEGYPDLVIDLQELIFEAPFAPFFHRWEKFEHAKDTEEDEQTKSHLELLHEALSLELKSTITKHRDLVRHNAIDFDILWTLFTPGVLMYSVDHGHDRLYKTGDCEYYSDLSGGTKFIVRCSMIDWDGEKFGMVSMSESINKFKGSKKITSLSSYPLQFHPDAQAMKTKIVERGRKFKSLAGVHCKDYKGTAIEYSKFTVQTVTSKRHIEGRIMLDEEMFSKFNPEEAQDVKEIEDDDDILPGSEELDKEVKKAKADTEKIEEEKTSDKIEVQEKKEDSEKKIETEKPSNTDQTDVAKEQTETELTAESSAATENQKENESQEPSTPGIPTPASSASSSEESNDTPPVLTEDDIQELSEFQLAICNSWLRGYSLTYQKWASFAVDGISDVVWNDNAFSELTLPADFRELILATIKSQIRQNQIKQAQEAAEAANKKYPTSIGTGKDTTESTVEFDDFIRGKGRGYIMLFAGNPGVGKTATAEAISELLHVPLCMISVGNLGTNAESVETGLQDILEIAAKWNAVLLLDEADIFLEQRTKHDLHRNAVVSVFLRLLEYYQGVLCLTTNRSEEIDVAFHSRIHISLPFPDLTEGSRENIWRQFAKMTDKKAEAEWQHGSKSRKQQNAAVPAPNGEISDTKTNDSKIVKAATVSEASSDTVSSEDGPILVNLSASDFRKLGQHPLNGRQIKNAFKTAVLLAGYKKERVGMKHVKTALKTIDGLKKEGMSMYT